MNLELIAALSGIVFGIAGLVFAVVCFGKYRKNRELTEFTFAQVEELANSLAENKEKLEAVCQRAADQSRRVAWLETRVRQPKAAKKDVLEETSLTENSSSNTAKFNITERRHRVLSLAKSGQNAETIAKTLGIFPGEVELIINLNRANTAQFA